VAVERLGRENGAARPIVARSPSGTVMLIQTVMPG
jgi:hypothetical protein